MQPIVIVGGGMVGISLALLLARQSPACSISLIEQYPFPEVPGPPPRWQPGFDDRSTALSAGSVAILRAIGCWQQLKDKAEPICRVHVSDRGHFGGLCLKAVDYQMDAVGYVIQNRWLGQVLIRQLQQSAVHCLAPARVTQCRPVAGGYRLTVKKLIDGNVSEQSQDLCADLHADLLVIADGTDSGLRQSLGITTKVHDYHQSALIANVALSQPHRGVAWERFTDEGPIALLPLGDLDGVHRASLVWTLPETALESLQQLPEADLLYRLQQRFGHRAGIIRAMGKRHIYPLTLVQALEQVRSHLVVIGNAAHCLHPVAGQGFNLSLRDCQALVDCLMQYRQPVQRSCGDLKVLNRYVMRQQRDQQSTIGLTDQLVKLFSSQTLPLTALRQLGLVSMNVVPMAKQWFGEKMMGI